MSFAHFGENDEKYISQKWPYFHRVALPVYDKYMLLNPPVLIKVYFTRVWVASNISWQVPYYKKISKTLLMIIQNCNIIIIFIDISHSTEP